MLQALSSFYNMKRFVTTLGGVLVNKKILFPLLKHFVSFLHEFTDLKNGTEIALDTLDLKCPKEGY